MGSVAAQGIFLFFMSRVNVYIDGFNLYHSVCKFYPPSPHLKWYNAKSLAQIYCHPNDILQNVYFYTAKPVHVKRQGVQDRFEKFTKALETTGVTVVLGRFKEKEQQINPKKIFIKIKQKSVEIRKFLSFKNFDSNENYFHLENEEKETDVNIALDLIDHAYQNICDKFILISGDSDLHPAIKRILNNFPKKELLILIPPHQSCDGIKEWVKNKYPQSLIKIKKIRKKNIEKNILPPIVIVSNGEKIEMPEEYKKDIE